MAGLDEALLIAAIYLVVVFGGSVRALAHLARHFCFAASPSFSSITSRTSNPHTSTANST